MQILVKSNQQFGRSNMHTFSNIFISLVTLLWVHSIQADIIFTSTTTELSLKNSEGVYTVVYAHSQDEPIASFNIKKMSIESQERIVIENLQFTKEKDNLDVKDFGPVSNRKATTVILEYLQQVSSTPLLAIATPETWSYVLLKSFGFKETQIENDGSMVVLEQLEKTLGWV